MRKLQYYTYACASRNRISNWKRRQENTKACRNKRYLQPDKRADKNNIKLCSSNNGCAEKTKMMQEKRIEVTDKIPEELMDEGYRLIDLIPRNQARGFASGIYDQLENIIDI